jgi:exodeoxyribonuclease V beta subunit
MTIHKSKGLEFDNVIVLDRLTKENPEKSNILFYYENAKLKDIKLKIKNRQIVDNYYKNIVKREENLKYEDKKNAEYVAFTRAKNALIVLKRADTTSKGASLSAFVSNLEKIQIGEVIPSKDENAQKTDKKKIKIKNYGKQEEVIQEEEYKPNDYEAIFLGNALHFAFECGDIEAVRNFYGDYCDMEEVKELFEKSKEKLPKGKKEVPFIYEKKVGRMDLFVEEETVIIDYKTTRPKDESGYVNQVRHYMKVVEKLTGKKPIGKIYYIDEQKFREV